MPLISLSEATSVPATSSQMEKLDQSSECSPAPKQWRSKWSCSAGGGSQGAGRTGKVGWAGSFPQDTEGIKGGRERRFSFYLGKGDSVADIGYK